LQGPGGSGPNFEALHVAEKNWENSDCSRIMITIIIGTLVFGSKNLGAKNYLVSIFGINLSQSIPINNTPPPPQYVFISTSQFPTFIYKLSINHQSEI
jgi:hypothetical protein